MTDEIEKKLDEILLTLHRIRPVITRFAVEEDESRMRLLRVDELAFVVSRREDQGMAETAAAPETALDAPEPKGAADDSLVVYSTDGKKFRSFTSLTALKNKYADVPGILETHRSYLVNLNAVTGIQTVPGGRLLSFANLTRKAKVVDDNVPIVEKYLLGE